MNQHDNFTARLAVQTLALASIVVPRTIHGKKTSWLWSVYSCGAAEHINDPDPSLMHLCSKERMIVGLIHMGIDIMSSKDESNPFVLSFLSH